MDNLQNNLFDSFCCKSFKRFLFDTRCRKRQGENWKGQCTKITPGGLLKERRSPAYCTVKALANGFPNCYGGQIATFFPALLGSSLPRDT